MLITDEHKEAIIKVLYQHPDWSSGVIHKKCFKYLDKIDVINTIRNHKRKGDNNEIFKEHQRQYLIYNNKKRRLLKYKEKPDSKKQEIIKEWQNDPKGPISDLINKFGVYVETVLYRYKETKEYWDFLAKWEKSHPNAEKRTNRSPKSEARLNVEAALIKNPKLKRPQLYKMFPDVPESNISSWVTSWKSEEVKVKKQKVAAAHAIFLEIYAKSQNCSATEIKIQYFANNEIITRRIVSEWITKYHKEHKDDPKRQKETAPACEKSLRKDERRTEKITKEFNGVSIQSIINKLN